MDDILKTMHEAGFKPTTNTDELPVLKGRYRAEWATLKPLIDKKTQDAVGYSAGWRIVETLEGDEGVGRFLNKSYRLRGTTFKGAPITTEDATKALTALRNDAFTAGVPLDWTSTEALEASFESVIGTTCWVKAYHFPSADEPDRKVQQVKILTEAEVRKGSSGIVAGTTGF
jgi:hypothetical protein